jgi:hypothetical protein
MSTILRSAFKRAQRWIFLVALELDEIKVQLERHVKWKDWRD